MEIEYHGTLDGGGKGRNILSLQELEHLSYHAQMQDILSIVKKCQQKVTNISTGPELSDLKAILARDTTSLAKALQCIEGLPKGKIGVLSNPQLFEDFDLFSKHKTSALIQKPKLETFNYLKHMAPLPQTVGPIELPLYYSRKSFQELPAELTRVHLYLNALADSDAFNKKQLIETVTELKSVLENKEAQAMPELKPIREQLLPTLELLQKISPQTFKQMPDGKSFSLN